MDGYTVVEVVEVWVMIDEDGNYSVALTQAELPARHDEDHNTREDGANTRQFKITLKVPKPAPTELVATVAEEPAAGELKLA